MCKDISTFGMPKIVFMGGRNDEIMIKNDPVLKKFKLLPKPIVKKDL